MLFKIQKSLIVFFLVSLLPLAACLPDMALWQKPLTVEVTGTGNRPQQSIPLYCKAGHGTALFGHEWYDFRDTPFTLYQGERANLKIFRLRGEESMMIQALFDGSGQKMIFCPIVDAPPDQRIPCASLYVLENDLHDGIKRTFDIPNAIRGGAITCAYRETAMKSLLTPASGGK